MATPDTSHRPSEVEWAIVPDYTLADNEGTHRCPLTGFAKRPDEVVYRGPKVDDFWGFFTIGQDAAEQLARLVGYVDPDEYEDPDGALVAENEALREENEKLQARLDAITEAVEA